MGNAFLAIWAVFGALRRHITELEGEATVLNTRKASWFGIVTAHGLAVLAQVWAAVLLACWWLLPQELWAGGCSNIYCGEGAGLCLVILGGGGVKLAPRDFG